jgi:pimeloyl-ACP methyl ester carboxylesterase
MTSTTEACFRLPGRTPGEPALQVRRLAGDGPSVIYVHGGTYPSANSFNWRFEGRSWADDLQARGFDAWSFDLPGHGGSDRPEGFGRPAEAGPPLLRAEEAAASVARMVDHVREATGRPTVALIAHSWGSMPAGLFATREPDKVLRLVLYAPFAERQGAAPEQAFPAWVRMTLPIQLGRMTADTPPGHPGVLLEPGLETWGPTYLENSDGEGVTVPAGASADVASAWRGALPWDPQLVRAPTLVVRGAWDSLCNDADAAWLAARFGGVERWEVRLPAAGHMIHLERGRDRLFAATAGFLEA